MAPANFVNGMDKNVEASGRKRCARKSCSVSMAHVPFWWEQLSDADERWRINTTINECCPPATYCCVNNLFVPRELDEMGMDRCIDDGTMGKEETYNTIKCAQRKFLELGDESANICRLSCCEIFYNVDTVVSLESSCSRTCRNGMTNPGLSWPDLLDQLRDENCDKKGKSRFRQFVQCVERGDDGIPLQQTRGTRKGRKEEEELILQKICGKA
ncbi:hypothetical protein niasHT_037415 [Heterodera trifolii]|uniref:Uncharacterized protein n=1 Tax=Heterodera trifolii TaxID=157864 RepID=A0ABD2J0P8_9BILA